ncbi:ABC transporter permease [Brenneria izbisi]|uniref:ABC transporter permease n=1 Tax=Brenneria izbisi TaxID=2939450 RepID=A0AA41Y1D8_9GAMM|nr:ABC transporter permease [Brenneria izbisi]MCV9877636.1 ABC transporter permease [Brenneria izbisi]MCV9880799.1 ABC transporter permease [Brenneria izbisi]
MRKPVSQSLPASRLRLIKLPRLPLTSAIALVMLALIVTMAIFAPWIANYDPVTLSPGFRLKPPSAEFWLGTDAYGRDLFSRIVYGARISLIVGLGVTLMSVLIGLPLGLLAGYFRGIDALLMRVMDGLMAIPGILLAIAIVSLSSAGIWTVMIAIMVPEIPQVVRLVRSRVLSAREEPYVEAAVLMGTSSFKILTRHLMPNTLAPLIVQSTYICASAILTEAILSFLGAGIGTEIPTWGNIIAEGRVYFQLKPSLVLWAGLALSLCILSINLLGDTVSDALDPRLKNKKGAA